MRKLLCLFICLFVFCAAVCNAVTPQPVMKDRIVSFHRGKANKELIRLAHRLGYNGVMFQLEGSTVKSLTEWAARDKREGYTQLCHSLGMKVTLWVHELSDIPGPKDAGYMGPVTLENEKLWKHLDDRYDWLFSELAPQIDGIVLTVVETQINATDTPLLLKLVTLIDNKRRQYDKQLVVRTFTWHPDELDGVMGAIRQFPDDITIMSKCVPQDWQMRGINNKAIGAVGNKDQFVEFDIAGEYFLLDHVANCMPQLLKQQFDYAVSKGVDGVCVRVDRWDAEVINQPSEVNLWALGMLASGEASTVDEIWSAWASDRFGKEAAPYLVEALKPTQQVVEEILNIGSFSFGDTRYFPPNVDRDALHTNWANWRWDATFIPEYKKGITGDPGYIRKIEADKRKAEMLALESLQTLESAKPHLKDADYQILLTKLQSNQFHLSFRSQMMLAWLKYRRLLQNPEEPEEKRLHREINAHLKIISDLAEKQFLPAQTITWRGETWQVGRPELLEQDQMKSWVQKMEKLLREMEVNAVSGRG